MTPNPPSDQLSCHSSLNSQIYSSFAQKSHLIHSTITITTLPSPARVLPTPLLGPKHVKDRRPAAVRSSSLSLPKT